MDVESALDRIDNGSSSECDVLEENDDLRAKLGMEPKEKLDLEDMNNLRAMRAQESRAVMHVMKREIEGKKYSFLNFYNTVKPR